MNYENLSFETVNAHVEENFNAEALAAPDLCGIYGTVKPILKLAAGFVLIPQTWRDAINVLIGVLDTMCPGH